MTRPLRIQERLEELDRSCAEAGLPVTSQRRAILADLVGRSDHPTVDQVYSTVVERLPEVSRTTVYRTLDFLCELGLVRRVPHPGSAVRFDGNTQPHHHFLCASCGELEDLGLEEVRGTDELELVGKPRGTVDEVTVLVRGTCRACAARGSRG